MANEIFISYRRQDGELYARLLSMYFDKLGLKGNVFIDYSAIDTDNAYMDELENKIKNCKDYILLLTPSVSNRWNEESYKIEEDVLIKELRTAINNNVKMHLSTNDKALLIKTKKDFENLVSRYSNYFTEDEIKEILKFFDYTVLDCFMNYHNDNDEVIINKIKSTLLNGQNGFSIEVEKLIKKSKIIGSGYSANESEASRLDKQSERAQDKDKEYISSIVDKVKENTNKNEQLVILDLGCFNGNTANKYFGEIIENTNSIIIGFDKNSKQIDSAKTKYGDKQHIYKSVNLNNIDEVKKSLDQTLEDKKLSKVDIIFCSQVLHHLDNDGNEVMKFLIENYLSVGGCVFVRGTDDRLKTIWNGNQQCSDILEELINHTKKLSGMSDREFGRKIGNFLSKWGLTNINVRPTFLSSYDKSLEERLSYNQELYKETYKWREYCFCPKNKEGEDGEKICKCCENKEECSYKSDNEKQVELCGDLREILNNRDCYYIELDIVGYGFKA